MGDDFGYPPRPLLFEINGVSNHLARKDDLDEMAKAAKTSPFAIRPVKKNALKASFLFQKQLELQSNVLRARHRCRMSINDITRNASDSLSNSIPIGKTHRNLRRSPEERKIDWRAAMSQVCVEEVGHNPDLQRVSSPVLPSILLNSEVNQRLDISGVPVQPISLPHQHITIASVWTNMVFELEMLIALLEKSTQDDRCDFKHSHNVTNIMEAAYPQGHSKESLITISSLLKSSRSWDILSVPRRSPLRATLGRSACNSSDIFETCFKGYSFSNACSRTKSTFKEKSCDWNNEEEVIFSSLRSLRKPFTSLSGLRTEIMMKQQTSNPWSVEVIRLPEFERDEAFAKSSTCSRLQLCSKVILPGDLLQTKCFSVPTALRTALQPKSLRTYEKTSYLSDLLRSIHQSSRIRGFDGLWSSGSREVMRKCHLKETILSSGFDRRGALLQMTQARDTLLVSKHIIGGDIILLEKAVDTLRRAFSKRSRSLLPFSIDLCEDLRFSFRQKGNHRIQPILSFEKLLDQYYDYDALEKNQSRTLTEHIPKCGIAGKTDPSLSALVESEYPNSKEERNGDNTSQESDLDNILTSDDEDQEPEPDAEPAMVVAQQMPMFKHRKHIGNREETTNPQSSLLRTKSDQQEPQRVRLRVPENLMCSPWSLKLAEHCVANMPRGTMLLPPCLSALPSLCIIINSHLSNRLQDQRVAIICKSESDISSGLSSYLEHTFARKMSVEVVKRWNFPSEPRYPTLNGCTAQILILNSFDFSLPTGVSLLIILVCEPRLICSRPQSSFGHQLSSINPEWPYLSSILIAPIDCWVPLPAYIDTAQRLSLELKTHAVLFVADYDDVHTSVLLAKPRALFLVPLKQASDLISVIDSHSCAALGSLHELFSKAKPGCPNPGAQSLSDFSVSYLRNILENYHFERNSDTYQSLETVYYLRQARSYALYDGFDVAMAFLSYCRHELRPESSELLQKVMKAFDTIEAQTATADADHPVVIPVAAHMKRMHEDFNKDPPSMSLTHRRTTFLPLIIADSREAVDGFQRGRTKAKLLFEARDRDIAICWLSDLVSISFKKSTSVQGKRVLDRLKEFSHIYHIIDGRENTHSESKFPPCILQLVHAGRTRLITVVVDERREMESIWTNSFKMYDTMRKYIGDQSRFSGMGGVQTLREMKWETVTHMLRSLW